MGLLLKALNVTKESGANYELGRSLSSTAVSTLFGTGGANINVLEEYSGYAWKAINIRAKMLSAEDLFVERMVGTQWQEDVNHLFNEVLEGTDGQRDLSELLEAHEKSMCLYGESFWYFSKGERTSKPMGVYLLDPSAMTVMIAADRVTGFVYQKDGNRVALDLDEVAHFKDEDPRNPFRGTGPMQAAGWFVRSARYVNTYVNNFLENNAIPAGVVVAKGTVNSDDWKLFKKQWAAKHAGIDNAGKTGFVRGSDLEFVKTGLSLGEVDFEKLKNASRDDVMIMFGISKPMMAIFDDINRASATVARQLFGMMITKPTLKALSRKLSKKVANWYGKQYRINSTNPVPEDDDAKLAKFDKGVGRWFTVNEARIAYGEEPIPGGDVIQPELKPTAEGTKSFLAPKTIGKVVIRTKSNKREFNYEMKESFRGETEDIQIKFEKKFYTVSNKLLSEQKSMVKNQIDPKKVVDAHFNEIEEAKKLADELLPIFIELAAVQGQLAAEFVGNVDSTFTLTSVIETYIKDSIARASLDFTKETQTKIATAIAEGLTAGEGVAKIGGRIDAIYKDVLGKETPGYRIERLARTETIKTSNEITEAAYKQSGVVSKKEWFANPGHCTYCAALDGSVINLGATFVPKGGKVEDANGATMINSYEDIRHPSLHPSCRCTLIPVIDEI